MRREIQLHSANITSIEDFHIEIANILGFPRYYTNTLEDLMDCLMIYIDPNLTIFWINHLEAQKHLGVAFDQIIDVFKRVQQEHECFEYYLN